ncbi:hypothetical protein [Bacillus infantis]|uniref:hypothetical protein n=1 Tax=Bacillus infantis TaxID=324767 RepID=UPI003CEA1F6B
MNKRLRTGACLAAIPYLMLAGCSQSVTSSEEGSRMLEESKLPLSEMQYTLDEAAKSSRFA